MKRSLKMTSKDLAPVTSQEKLGTCVLGAKNTHVEATFMIKAQREGEMQESERRDMNRYGWMHERALLLKPTPNTQSMYLSTEIPGWLSMVTTGEMKMKDMLFDYICLGGCRIFYLLLDISHIC